MNKQIPTVASYTRPRRKILKIMLAVTVLILLGIGLWFGTLAYRTLHKITALSSGNNSVLSLFSKNTATLKGESDGRTNILLMGIGGASHPGANLSDTMQVISINWKTNQISMISVPRDLWVNIPGHGYAKINEANSDGGGDLASSVVSQILGIPIHYYVTLNFSGFTQIINTLGGIDVNVPTAILDRNYPAYDDGPVTTFSISAGEHHMDGDLALKYARSRESTSDFDRSKRQQLIMQAVKTKAMSLGILTNPAKLSSLLNAIGNNIKMSISVSEIKPLWDEVQKVDTSNMITKVIDDSSDGLLNSSTSSGGASILIPKKGIGNYTDLQALAQNIFATQTSTSESVSPLSYNIEILNGSGKNGVAQAASNLLTTNGFKISSVSSTTKIANTIVYNCKGAAAENVVSQIIKLIGGTESTKTSCGAIDIQVIMGQSTNIAG